MCHRVITFSVNYIESNQYCKTVILIKKVPSLVFLWTGPGASRISQKNRFERGICPSGKNPFKCHFLVYLEVLYTISAELYRSIAHHMSDSVILY